MWQTGYIYPILQVHKSIYIFGASRRFVFLSKAQPDGEKSSYFRVSICVQIRTVNWI